MADQIITNPLAAWGTVTSFLTGVDANGMPIAYSQSTEQWRANEAIAANQCVSLIAPTATVPVSVEVMDVSDVFAALMFIGVASEAAVAGALVTVVTQGVVVVSIDDGAPIFGDVAIKHATVDGAVISGGTLGGTWDAADVAGTALGVFLGAEIGTSNTALMRIAKF